MKKCYFILTAVILFAVFAVPADANAAEPSLVRILVRNAPEDIALELVSRYGDFQLEGWRNTVAWETYYTFLRFHGFPWSSRLPDNENFILRVSGGGINYEMAVRMTRAYNNLYTLDFETRILTSGAGLARSVTLISLRVGLTLIIEGLIFLMFRFREKRSWLVFLCANLLTQGALNIWLNAAYFNPAEIAAYIIFGLFFAEILIFMTEMILYRRFIREHSKRRVTSYAFCANFASFVLGGALIMYLPV